MGNLNDKKQTNIFVFLRTPVRWLKFRPEKPMGEILEEGDKGDEEKQESGEGQEGTEKPTAEKREGSSEETVAIKEVLVLYSCKLGYNLSIFHFAQKSDFCSLDYSVI